MIERRIAPHHAILFNALGNQKRPQMLSALIDDEVTGRL